MRVRPTLLSAVLAFGALLFVLVRANAPASDPGLLGVPRSVAPGVALYSLSDGALLDPPAPVSIHILRVDPARADVRPALARDRIMHTETVASIAGRHRAVAAINAGFFLPNGDPFGIYKLQGQLVSDARRPRGAVGILRESGIVRLVFGRVSTSVALRVYTDGRPVGRMDVAGVDTTRLRGRLMLFTPVYYSHTDTAPGGLEWVIAGDPLRVTAGPRTGGKTPIPEGGFVLSFGGRTPPPLLASLVPGDRVELETTYHGAGGEQEWALAQDIIGGAGLLARDGEYVEAWEVERFTAGFADLRHPRTMIGTRSDGSIWLVVVDGRQPDLSAGMTLAELRQLARRLGLTNALNLDGGGSTTMWVAGEIVNSPSDPAGPRPVSDALLVLAR